MREAVLILVVWAAGYGVKRLGFTIDFLHNLALLQWILASVSPSVKMMELKMTRPRILQLCLCTTS